MTCTNQQVIRLKQMSYKYNKEVSAAKSGMTSKTARSYLLSNQLPSERKKQETGKLVLIFLSQYGIPILNQSIDISDEARLL